MSKEYQRFQFVPPPTIILPPYLFYDDCEGNFKYYAEGDEGDEVAEYSTNHPFTGQHHLNLLTSPSSTAAGDQSLISLSLGSPVLNNLLLSFFIRTAYELWDFCIFYISLTLRIKPSSYLLKLKINFDTLKIYVLTQESDYLEIQNLIFPQDTYLWSYVQLNALPSKHQLQNLIVNGQKTDLLSYTMPNAGSADYNTIDLNISVEAQSNSQQGVNLSNIAIVGQ